MTGGAGKIADAFAKLIDEHGPLEKTNYYSLQRACIALMGEVHERHGTLDAVVRFADQFARELEDEAVLATYLLFWKRRAIELERLTRLVDFPVNEASEAARREAFDILSRPIPQP